MGLRFVSFAGRGKTVLCSLASIYVFFAICVGSPCFAAEVSTFAGTEIDGRGQGFSYLGVDVSQNLNKTVAISGRVMPNYLTYKYYSGNTLVRAKSPGVFAVAGFKLSWGQTVLGLYGGIESRDTDLSPDDRSSSVRGRTSAGMVQGEFSTWLTKGTNFNISGSYSGTTNFTYERAGIKQQITNLDFKGPYTFYAGVEQSIGRNKDYRGENYGALIELFYIPLKVSIGLRGGYKHDSTFGNGGYGGLQLYKGF